MKRKETGDDFWADYERDLAQLNEAEKELEELKAENANLEANQQVLLPQGLEVPDGLDHPEEAEELSFLSVTEAVQAATKRLNNVRFPRHRHFGCRGQPVQPYL